MSKHTQNHSEDVITSAPTLSQLDIECAISHTLYVLETPLCEVEGGVVARLASEKGAVAQCMQECVADTLVW